jgi:hypothetical protein
VQVHPPAGHVENEQCAPASHWRLQWPLEHATLHVEPEAHAVKQPPLEQSTLQVAPLGHDVLQPPLEQSTVHCPSPQ